jgi:hypothetical protein
MLNLVCAWSQLLAAPRRIHHSLLLEKHERRIIYNIDKALQFVLSHQENMVAAIINQYGLFPSRNIYFFGEPACLQHAQQRERESESHSPKPLSRARFFSPCALWLCVPRAGAVFPLFPGRISNPRRKKFVYSSQCAPRKK